MEGKVEQAPFGRTAARYMIASIYWRPGTTLDTVTTYDKAGDDKDEQ